MNVLQNKDLIYLIFLNLNSVEDFKNLCLVSKIFYRVSKTILRNLKTWNLRYVEDTYYPTLPFMYYYEQFPNLKSCIIEYNKEKQEDYSEVDNICNIYEFKKFKMYKVVYPLDIVKDRNNYHYLHYGWSKFSDDIKYNIKLIPRPRRKCPNQYYCDNYFVSKTKFYYLFSYKEDLEYVDIYGGCQFGHIHRYKIYRESFEHTLFNYSLIKKEISPLNQSKYHEI